MLKSRFTSTYQRKELIAKINRLLADGRKTSLNVEIDKKRYHGQLMGNVTLTEESLYFAYGEESFDFSLDDLIKTRRLRARKYLLLFEPDRKLNKAEKKAEKKSEDKKESPEAEAPNAEKKDSKKKVTKKTGKA